MDLEFSKEALSDLKFWKNSGNKAIQKRISELLISIKENPLEGIGKPEKLRFNLSGLLSRRIDSEHRIVYSIKEDKIIIYSLRYHY